MLDAFAQDEELAIEVDAGSAAGIGHEAVPEAGHDGARGRPDHRVVDRHAAPADDAQALPRRNVVDDPAHLVGAGGVGRKEREADAVGASGRQLEVGHLAQEGVGDLDEDAGAVAGVDLGAGCASMVEVAEGAERGIDDVPALRARYVNNKSDAAGIVLEAGVIQAAGVGQGAERYPARGGTPGLNLAAVSRWSRSGIDSVACERMVHGSTLSSIGVSAIVTHFTIDRFAA